MAESYGPIRAAVEESVTAARKAGKITKLHSATVAGLRMVADRLDVLDIEAMTDTTGKLDNVSLPTFLKYCTALGLVPETVEPVKSSSGAGRPKKVSELDAWRAKRAKGA